MEKQNKVFIATSLDGYIAGPNGEVDWLHAIPNPEQDSMGYDTFMSNIDAIVMGRKTFETVSSFDIAWPYQKTVYVLSREMKSVPSDYRDKVKLVRGSLNEILSQIHSNQHYRLYIDGGTTIQSFLNEDRIDEMIITTIPILLGRGIPLFSHMRKRLEFECVSSRLYLDCIVQNHFVRKRGNLERAESLTR